MTIRSQPGNPAMSTREQRIEELIRVLPVIMKRGKPDPSRVETFCSASLSPSESRVLVHLALHKGNSAGMIAEEIALSRPATTEAIDRLAEKGMIRREPCPTDRRKVRIVLTAPAVEVANQFIDRWRAGFDRAFDRLTQEEQAAFHKGMFALADSLGELDVPGSA